MSDQQLTTTGNQHLTLEERITAVNELLQPASADAVASAILKMARAGLSYPPGLDAKRAGDIYGFACKGQPIEAIKRAVMKVVQGLVPNISRDFIPTPPSFAAIVREEARDLWADRDRLLLTSESMRPNAPRRPTPDEIERVRAMNAAFQAKAAEFRAQQRAEFQEREAKRLAALVAISKKRDKIQ